MPEPMNADRLAQARRDAATAREHGDGHWHTLLADHVDRLAAEVEQLRAELAIDRKALEVAAEDMRRVRAARARLAEQVSALAKVTRGEVPLCEFHLADRPDDTCDGCRDRVLVRAAILALDDQGGERNG